VAQVKKAEVRDAILDGASVLFTETGYSNTTLAEIARESGVTISNIYNYFGSKLEVLVAIYEPWLNRRFDQLERDVASIVGARNKFRAILLAILRDIPKENNCFSNNFLQGIATRKAGEVYSRELLLRSEQRISASLAEILPPRAQHLVEDDLLSHFLFMAHDGFTINTWLNGPSRRVEAIVETLCELVFGPENG